MFVVLTEDDYDFAAFKHLIRRLANDPRLPIGGRGYDGCSEMLNKGARFLNAAKPPVHYRCIVVHDCDDKDERALRLEVERRIFRAAGLRNEYCIVVPREEIEAWILADFGAIKKIVPSWDPPKEIASPETLSKPKEYLHKLSRDAKMRPRISEANNPRLMEHLDLNVVERKCPSFRVFAEFVRATVGA